MLEKEIKKTQCEHCTTTPVIDVCSICGCSICEQCLCDDGFCIECEDEM